MQTLLNEDQRLVMLRSLLDCGNDANESILNICLDKYGHRISRDAVRAHMDWLKDTGLITIDDVCGCYVATITSRGQDVAEGRTTVSGVKKPRAR